MITEREIWLAAYNATLAAGVTTQSVLVDSADKALAAYRERWGQNNHEIMQGRREGRKEAYKDVLDYLDREIERYKQLGANQSLDLESLQLSLALEIQDWENQK